MNDYFAHILHADRMAEFERDADRYRLAASVKGGGRRERHAGRARAAPILWLVPIVLAALAATLAVGTVVLAGGGHGGQLAQIRAGTALYHDLERALADGYSPLHICTDEETGLGAMGQHYVNGALLGDGVFDLSRPEVLVYEPMQNGRMRLVAVEFVEFVDVWGATPPELFGRQLQVVPVPNRYDVPLAFYQIHVWVWKHNPSGMFSDWNPRVSCRGIGDPE